MTVILGDTFAATGSGTWSYPHVGTVLGIVLQIPDPTSMGKVYGTEILRAKGLGVYAPLSEAGSMRCRAVFNAEEVTYDIGHSPVGVAFDLPYGLELDITEILSEVPTGGGGTGVTGYGSIGGFCSGTFPTWNGPDLPTWCGYDAGSWAGTDATGIVVPATDFYHFSLLARVTSGTVNPDALGLEWHSVASSSVDFGYYYESAWPQSETTTAEFFNGILSNFGTKVDAGTRILPRIWTIGGDPATYDFLNLIVVACNT